VGGARESFPRKLEPDWGTEIECGQSADEQRIVPVGGLLGSDNWPQNSTQLLNKDVCFHGSRHTLGDRLSDVGGAFVREDVAKKVLKSAPRASAAPAPITESAQRQVTEHLLTNGFRREIQHLANV
jgi:hypothetical protein